MIPINELMVGNWIDVSGTKFYKKVTSINGVIIQDNIQYQQDESYDWTEWQTTQPIAITPEILKKCGFTFQKNLAEWANVTEDYSYYFIELPSGKKLEVYLDNSCNLLDAGSGELKSLHQLQNLYFLIVGKELEVKL